MKKLLLSAALLPLLLASCAWETYTDQNGHTALRQKYPTGTPIFYQDGTYARDQHYNRFRPIQRALTREDAKAPDETRIHWQPSSGAAGAGASEQGFVPATAQ